MNKLNELLKILDKYGVSAKKQFGQNFLLDDFVLDKIISSSNLSFDDRVIEVGPGTGFLTEKLINNVGNLYAIEKDDDMCKILRDKFDSIDNFNLFNSDILGFDLSKLDIKDRGYKLIANIPYYISSPLLRHFLQNEIQPSLIILLIQKEVAEKICAIKSPGLITIESQIFASAEIIDYVSAESFYPVPKVESAILKLETFDKSLIDKKDLPSFLRLLKFAFSQKRKKLNNTLSAGLHISSADIKNILTALDIDFNLRAENLSIEEWKRLHKICVDRGLV